MSVKMLAGTGVLAMPVRLGFQRDTNKAHLAVRYAPLRNHAFGKVTDRRGFSRSTATSRQLSWSRCTCSVATWR